MRSGVFAGVGQQRWWGRCVRGNERIERDRCVVLCGPLFWIVVAPVARLTSGFRPCVEGASAQLGVHATVTRS